MDDDGTMARGEKLHNFAKKHKLKIGKIDDLIAYRLKKEKLIKLKKKSNIEVKVKKYSINIFENLLDGSEHFALIKGKIKKGKDKLIKNYGIGAQIIKSLHIKNMILVTRSKKKVVGLDGYGIKINKQEIIK